MDRAIYNFVCDNLELFKIGYPVSFVKIEGFAPIKISKQLKIVCNEPLRLRQNSKQVREIADKMKEFNEDIAKTLYNKDSTTQLRFYIVDEDLLQKYRPAEEPAEDTQVEEEEQKEAPVIDGIIYKGDQNTKWQQHNVFTRYKIKLVDGRAQICNNSYKAVKPKKLEAADCYAVKIYGSLEYLDYIIAEHFIPHSLEFNVLEHIDGNKQNNNIMNLRWVKQK